MEQRLHISCRTRPIVTVRSGDHLPQFHACLFPAFGLVAITKIVRRASSVKHCELTKIFFPLQHVAQDRAQRRDTSTHRNEDKISVSLCLEWKAVSRDANQINSLALLHFEYDVAGAYLLLHQYFQLRVFGRTRKSKVGRSFTLNPQRGDLTRNKRNAVRSRS